MSNPLGSPLYRAAFAQWMPIMQERWASCVTLATLLHAKADVWDAIRLQESVEAYGEEFACPSYLGKLYAELDAIRDALAKPRHR